MEKVFEIELTLLELEIIRLGLTGTPGYYMALSCFAKRNGIDPKTVMKTSENLLERISNIIDKNTV